MNIVSRFTIEKKLQYQSDESFRNNINFILTFASIVIFGIFAIRPSITTITNLIKDIDEYAQVNGVLLEKIAILNEVQSNPDKMAKETALISQALPNSPDESSYLRNITFIASKNNIGVETVNFGVGEAGTTGVMVFSISTYGTYPEMVGFITDINKLLRISTIDEVNISPITGTDNAVKATITGKTYFLEDK